MERPFFPVFYSELNNSNKFQVICPVFATEMNWLGICVLPLEHSHKSCDFDGFPDFLNKLESFSCTVGYLVDDREICAVYDPNAV